MIANRRLIGSIRKSLSIGLNLALVAFGQFARAAGGVPSLLPFDGRLTDSNGAAITTATVVNFRIYPPTGTCYIFEDTQTVIPNSSGLFSVTIGDSGHTSGPANAFSQIFSNESSLSLVSSCVGTNYTPAANDLRRLEIVIAGVPLAGMQTIGSSAFALNSNMLDGKTSAAYIQTSPNVTQTNVEGLTNSTDASGLHHHDGRYLKIDGTTSMTGALTTSNNMLATGASSKVGIGTASPSVDLEIARTNPTILLKAASGGNGQMQLNFNSGATARGAIKASENANGLQFFSGSTQAMSIDPVGNLILAGSLSIAGTTGLGKYTDAQETTMVAGLTAGSVGTVWSNTTSKTIKYWDGTAVQTLSTGAGGSSAGMVAKAGDTMTGILTLSADPVASLDASTKQYVDAGLATLGGSFIRKDGTAAFTGDQSMGTHKLTNVVDPASAQDAATKNYVDTKAAGGDLSGTLGASTVAKIQNIAVDVTGLANGQVLSYSSVLNKWLPANLSSGAVTSVNLSLPGEFSVSGGPVTSSGTLTGAWASQAANKVLASPNGSAGVPTFRSIAAADLSGGAAGNLLYNNAGVWAAGAPDTAGVVDKTNNQTIAGNKTFSGATALGTTSLGDTSLTGNVTTSASTTHDYSAATSFKIPVSAGAAPTVSGLLAYDSTSNYFKMGANGVSYYMVNADFSVAPTDGQVLSYDAATSKWKPVTGAGGGGIGSLNGLGSTTQTLAIGSAGTAPAFSSATSTHTLNIPMASTASVTAGLLSKTDYDVFNTVTTKFTNGGNSFAGAATLGTSDNYSLAFETNNTTRMTVDTSGNLGIGSATPRGRLEVAGGSIVGATASGSASTTIDFSTGNLKYTSSSCGAIAMNNMKDGAAYTLAIQGTTSATCSFTAYSDAGVTALTVKLPLSHGPTTAGKHTIYTFLVMGSFVYASWIPGY